MWLKTETGWEVRGPNVGGGGGDDKEEIVVVKRKRRGESNLDCCVFMQL